MAKNLIERVLKTLRNYHMVRRDDVVMAAVSGGPDSVFLMHALASLRRKMAIKDLSVCNMDHCLRGAESEEDSRFAMREAESLGLKFFHEKVDVSRAVSREMSTEEIARDLRYAFFGRMAQRAGANVLATGHTIDDQAETVLMRVIKGSSLKGLAGISPARDEKGLRIIRPLVEIEKREIMEYLDSRLIRYRIDSSNLGDKYFRNVVRREVVPFLERYNPRLKRSLSNLAEHLREDLEFIRREKLDARGKIACAKDGAAEMKLKDILMQPVAIQKELLRDMLESSGGQVKKLSFRHWKELECLLKTKGKGRSLDLPGSIRATRTATSIVLRKI